MNKRSISLIVVVGILILAGVTFSWRRSQSRAPSPGQALYVKHCAVCHGPEGRGDGKAAYLLNPKPRNFRAGKFRLVTSLNLQPTRDDVFRTVTNGMPGTAMPAWGQLSESDRRLLADYVLKLNYDGYVEKALKGGDSKRAAVAYAKEMSTPDQPIPIPPEPPVTRLGLEEGRQFYVTNCSKCHAKGGEGRTDRTWRTSEGYPTWSRNLKEGVFKGGRDGSGLYLRFHTGLPGTPMPSLVVPPERVWRIVQYVQSLSDPSAQERATLKPVALVAKRVSKLPSGFSDPAWDSVPETRIPLMPLWWINGYIGEVNVRTVHDGQRLAILLRWNDPTRDAGGVRQQDFPDAAAIQFSASPDPPLFAMGSPGQPVYFWHWKALWDEDLKTFQDIAQAFPNATSDAYFGAKKGWHSEPLEDATFVPARRLDNPVARVRRTSVEEATAAGFGTYTAEPADDQNVEGASLWKGGVWRVSFVRDLVSSQRGDLAFRPGVKLPVAFAVWNGNAVDRNGQKTVSIWNTLTVEK